MKKTPDFLDQVIFPHPDNTWPTLVVSLIISIVLYIGNLIAIFWFDFYSHYAIEGLLLFLVPVVGVVFNMVEKLRRGNRRSRRSSRNGTRHPR